MLNLEQYAQDITVELPIYGDGDSFGDTQVSFEIVEANGVLISPVSTMDLPDPYQLFDNSVIRVDFPQEFNARLRNAVVIAYGGRRFAVQGDPLPVYGSPLKWDRFALCVGVD